MEQETAKTSGVKVLNVSGPRLDAVNAPAFREITGAVIDSGHNRIILNLAEVLFIDSSGIGALVGLLKRTGLFGDVVLTQLTPNVQKAFKLTRMDRIFSIFPDTAAAVAALEEQ